MCNHPSPNKSIIGDAAEACWISTHRPLIHAIIYYYVTDAFDIITSRPLFCALARLSVCLGTQRPRTGWTPHPAIRLIRRVPARPVWHNKLRRAALLEQTFFYEKEKQNTSKYHSPEPCRMLPSFSACPPSLATSAHVRP